MRQFFLFIVLFSQLFGEDAFINPITDICWECVFPMTIAGVQSEKSDRGFEAIRNLKPSQNQRKDKQLFCFCRGIPPRPGIPISFWEPVKLIDVTKEAYKLVGMGGVKIGNSSLKNRGTIKSGLGSKTSFSHVHIYDYPVFALLEILTDFACIETGEFELSYFSELDYTWYDDSLSNILNPEVALFANPLAQAACITDCVASTANKPLDKLFWCGGCHGSIYPFSGTVSSHIGLLQEALLLSQRSIAKMHRTGFLKGYKEGDYCEKSYMPIWQKSLYKIQIASPVPQTSGECPSLGGSEVLWGVGKSYPKEGEEFVFVLWSKKQCCLDAVKIAAKAYGAEVP